MEATLKKEIIGGTVWKSRENPINRIRSKWSKKRIRRALKTFSFGGGSRKMKRDAKAFGWVPRFQLNAIQDEYNIIPKGLYNWEL